MHIFVVAQPSFKSTPHHCHPGKRKHKNHWGPRFFGPTIISLYWRKGEQLHVESRSCIYFWWMVEWNYLPSELFKGFCSRWPLHFLVPEDVEFFCWTWRTFSREGKYSPGSLSWPLKISHPKRKVIFQPSFFRGYLKFRGCTSSCGRRNINW